MGMSTLVWGIVVAWVCGQRILCNVVALDHSTFSFQRVLVQQVPEDQTHGNNSA